MIARASLSIVIACVACGRIHFDATGDGNGSAATDASFTGQHTAYIKASTTHVDDEFGNWVALDAAGDRLAVGAWYEDGASTGINGDQTNNSAGNAGAAYTFVRTNDTWAQDAYVKASNTGAGDNFGLDVALSGDGSRLVVSAIYEASAATGVDGNQADNSAAGAGAVYVFDRSGGTWAQTAYLKASNTDAQDNFGYAIAMSTDGNTLAVAAFFEASAATGIDGNQADNSAARAGAVYVFAYDGAWAQQAYVKASNTDAQDIFGEAVALSADGNTLAVGAPLESSASPGIDGNQADNSASQAGAVYVFTRAGTTWTQQAYVKASNPDAFDQFGWAVALSASGDVLAVGARGEASAAPGIDGEQTDNSESYAGAVYAFRRAGATWSQDAYIKASNPDTADDFGQSVSLTPDGNWLLVGAPNESSAATGLDGDQTDNSAMTAGALYLFSHVTGSWVQRHYIKATNTGAGDQLVWGAISADSSTIAAGAQFEDSDATGIDGDQADNSATDSGAAYIYY
ncbi:MAG TPA: hypothetical protein VMJ10_04650 [Kofleriaceae bacterium]|nr:hypothetical protein [Kofleriaceae bacterium]